MNLFSKIVMCSYLPILFLILIAYGAQGEKEKEAGILNKRGPTETPTTGADAPTGPTRSGV